MIWLLLLVLLIGQLALSQPCRGFAFQSRFRLRRHQCIYDFHVGGARTGFLCKPMSKSSRFSSSPPGGEAMLPEKSS